MKKPKIETSGVLLVNKPTGITSYDVIRKLKTVARFNKIGHTGTLDPIAKGLLVIAINKATKLSQQMMDLKKEYIVTAKMGEETDTDDREGKVIRESNKKIDEATLVKALYMFKGEIEQVPPRFSALRIKGKRAYELARNNVDFTLPPRKVRIYAIELISMEYPFFTIKVTVGKGAYVRALIRDVGRVTGALAHVHDLIRTKVGLFTLDHAIPDLENISFELIQQNIIPIDRVKLLLKSSSEIYI